MNSGQNPRNHEIGRKRVCVTLPIPRRQGAFVGEVPMLEGVGPFTDLVASALAECGWQSCTGYGAYFRTRRDDEGFVFEVESDSVDRRIRRVGSVRLRLAQTG